MDSASSPELFQPAYGVAFLSHNTRTWSFTTAAGLLNITLFADTIVRFSFIPFNSSRNHRSLCLPDLHPAPSLPIRTSQNASIYEIRTAHLVLSVKLGATLQIQIERAQPHSNGISLGNIAFGFNRYRQLTSKWTLYQDARIFGGGQQTGSTNKRGKIISLWNTDPLPDHHEDTGAMYQNVPFFQVYSAKTMHGIFLDSTWHSYADLGASEPDSMYISTDAPEFSLFFFNGPHPADVLEQYTHVTGRPIALPRWALGNQQSRWGYMDDGEVRAVARQFREQSIPCDAIYLDIDYMNGYRDFTWNDQTFSKPAELISDLADQGFHIIPIIDPGVKVDAQYAVYREGMEKGYFVRAATEQPYEGWVWPGLSVWADFSREDVRAWWGNLHADFVSMGIAGIWDDMNEPSQSGMSAPPDVEIPFGATLPLDAQHGLPDSAMTHAEFHNIYGLEMAHATYDGLRRLNPDVRPFVLTRAATAGTQRYAVVWNGDNSSIWEHLRLAISMNIGLGLSGLPLTGFDIGGFWHDATPELLVRFTQIGIFMPFCRNHSSMGTVPQEPWAFGEPYTGIIRSAIELRYRLLPYMVTLARATATSGVPMIRPIWWNDFTRDLVENDDAFLLGDALFVAPILDADISEHKITLPAGEWFIFSSDECLPASDPSLPQTCAMPVTLKTIPLFVRAGSIIPMAPAAQYTAEPYTEPLELHVYLTPANNVATGNMWDDDDHPNSAIRGSFAAHTFTAKWKDQTIECHIQRTEGAFPARYPAGKVIWHLPAPWKTDESDTPFDIQQIEQTVSVAVHI